MILLPDSLKRAILHVNRFIGTLERHGIISYQDKIRLRSPQYHKGIHIEQPGNDRIGELIERNEPLMIARLGSARIGVPPLLSGKEKGKEINIQRQDQVHHV